MKLHNSMPSVDGRLLRILDKIYWHALKRLGLGVPGVVRARSDDYSVEVPLGISLDISAIRAPVAVVCHLYNADLASELHGYLRNIPVPANLYVSTDTQDKADMLRDEFALWRCGNVDIRIVPNRGRDIAPKYVTFRDVYEEHEIVLFVHSKKSTHIDAVTQWRRSLLGTLCGSTEIVAGILGIFANYPRIGAVIPQHYPPMRPFLDWRGTYFRAQKVASIMQIRLRQYQIIDFAAGSMFWARSSALHPILDLNLTVEEFPQEGGQVEGTLAHMLERLLLHSCEKAGFDWLKVSTPQFCDAPENEIPVHSQEDLEKFIDQHCIRILG